MDVHVVTSPLFPACLVRALCAVGTPAAGSRVAGRGSPSLGLARRGARTPSASHTTKEKEAHRVLSDDGGDDEDEAFPRQATRPAQRTRKSTPRGGECINRTGTDTHARSHIRAFKRRYTKHR